MWGWIFVGATRQSVARLRSLYVLLTLLQAFLVCSGVVTASVRFSFFFGPLAHPPRSLAFMGFARPAFGSIPPCSEMQSRLHAMVVGGAKKLPKEDALRCLAKKDQVKQATRARARPVAHRRWRRKLARWCCLREFELCLPCPPCAMVLKLSRPLGPLPFDVHASRPPLRGRICASPRNGATNQRCTGQLGLPVRVRLEAREGAR